MASGPIQELPIAVVIVNWQRPGDTIECVESLRASSLAARIVIVDNGSADDSVQQFSGALPEATVIALPENIGFAGGYNAGIRHALSTPVDTILLLNNDTVVAPDTLDELARSHWDVSVPKILRYDAPERLWAAGARWRPFPPSVVMLGFGLFGRGEKDAPRWNTPGPLDYATGCALLLKRCVLENVGGFDLAFENYMEDYDFCYRIRRAGFTIGYVPTAVVLHKVSQSLGEGSERKWHYLGQNTVLFYRKDNRFPAWMFWTYVMWVSLRETIKGQVRSVPYFWQGVRAGLDKLAHAA